MDLELSTGAMILVVGVALSLVGFLFFPLLCISVPLLLVGVVLFVVQGGKVTKEKEMAQLQQQAWAYPGATPPAVTPQYCRQCGRPMTYDRKSVV